MGQRVLSVIIGLIWVAVFGYLIHEGLYAVTIISFILLGMTLALSTSNDNSL